jgi:hypothetical protein
MSLAVVGGLRARIAAALGLGPLLLAAGAGGCVVRSLDDERGGGDMGEDGEASGSSETDPTGAASLSGTASATGDGSSSATTVDGSEDDGTTQACWPSDHWLEWELWLPPGPGGDCTCGEECQSLALAQWNSANCCDSCSYAVGSLICAELLGDTCHYILMMQEDVCGEGRPLLVDGHARTAAACERTDWAQPSIAPRMEGLSAAQRRALAERWTRTALAEHASVASFARFALDLAALAAPPELLAETTAAMRDEIRHARLAFALAAAYAGHPVGPGPLPMHGLTAGDDAEAIVRAAVREGCVEETLSAAEAELAAHRATDPAVRAALLAIADDEARHAVLAWRFVSWAVQRDPSLATVVREELRRALEASASDGDDAIALPVGGDDDVLSAHGLLPAALRERLRARCLRGTIRPCAAAMLHRCASGETATPRA